MSASKEPGRCADVGDWASIRCAVCGADLGPGRPKRLTWRFIPTMSLSGRIAVCNSHTVDEIRGVTGPNGSGDPERVPRTYEALLASVAKVDPVLHLALTWAKAGWLTIAGDWRNRRVHRNGEQVPHLAELAVNGMYGTFVTVHRDGLIRLTDAGAEMLKRWDAQVMDEVP